MALDPDRIRELALLDDDAPELTDQQAEDIARILGAPARRPVRGAA